MDTGAHPISDGRRITVGLLAGVLLVTSAALTYWQDQAGASNFAASAAGRIGLVLAALCLAWPSLQRPARWLPPGIAVLCLGALVAIAATPKLVVVVIPALGMLTVLATFVRAFRK